jgi:hypothetical protein
MCSSLGENRWYITPPSGDGQRSIPIDPQSGKAIYVLSAGKIGRRALILRPPEAPTRIRTLACAAQNAVHVCTAPELPTARARVQDRLLDCV